MPQARSLRLKGLLCAFLLLLGIAPAAFAAGKKEKQQSPGRVAMVGPTQVVNASSFAISPPLGAVVGVKKSDEFAPGSESEIPLRSLPKESQAQGLGITKADADAALQLYAPQALMPAPTVSFDGVSSQDNFNALGFRVYPPDTNGVVGPNHYVQMVNLLVRIYDKTGTPLTAPFTLSSFFAACGCQCGAADDGDPVVVYDQLADRWILSQFGFASSGSPPYYECIAISTTGDPTGTYYVYDFLTPGNEFPDYPKLGVWPDGYYMTTNQFTNGGPFDGAGVFAFERAKMLTGDPSASLIYFNLSLASFPEGIGGMLPSTLDGITPPPAGAPNVFAYFTADEWGDPADGLRLFDFHADWAIPANSTFIERPESSYASPVAVAAFNPLTPAGRDDIEQPPPSTSSTALDAIADRLLHRLQYRNFGSHQSLVVNHTVNVNGSTTLGTYRAGVRYYELRSTGGAYSVNEQGTFAPTSLPGGGTDTSISRWMGSAAMDASGNLAVGYSAASVNTFPSIWYAGRLSTDPAGTLGQGEAVLINGSGVQTGTASRWGDYSALTVDPSDGCSFWYTTEYYTLASQGSSTVGWLTRIGKFSFGANCTPPQQGTLVVNVTDCGTAANIAGASVSVDSTMYGVTGAGGSFSTMVAPGSYTVSVSAAGYPAATSPAVITNGGTTTLNICLSSLPVLSASGTSLTSEDCAPPNGAVDPGELVTLDFSLTNVGLVDTVNLVATLQATGGVTGPSGPQNYGVVVASGPAVSKSFTFRADGALACGDTITATLQLQDGATNLGTVAFPISTGVLATPFSENFDGVTAPALPAGWTASNASGAALWVTSTASPDSAPNSAFIDDPSTVSDKRLDTPSIPIATATAQLSFRNDYNLEASTTTNTGWDGGVLEISIGGGAFADIIAAGGSFVTGGYTKTISSSFSNPLAGREAWSGDAGGYINTTVDLPAAAAGQNVVLRFRMGSDSSVSRPGWNIDGLTLTDGYQCCVSVCQPITFTPALYGSDTIGNLFTINEANGAGTYVGLLFNAGCGAGVPGSTEIEFDPVSGRAFNQYPDGSFTGWEFDIDSGTAIGACIPNGGAYNGLEAVNGTWYGTAIYGPNGPSELRTVNPFTGTSSLVGPTGIGPISGLAYDQASGTMYGITGGGSSFLVTLSLATGAATVVGPTGMQASGSLQFGAGGRLFAGGGQSNAGEIWTINPATGSGTFLGNSGFGTVSGLTLAGAASPPGLVLGSPYTYTLVAYGGIPPYTYAVTAGTLPPGITLSAGGVLSGTPTAQGSYTFTVTATDSTGCTGDGIFTLGVYDDIFVDDGNASRFCVDTATGLYGWGVTAPPSAFYGRAEVMNGGAYIWNGPADPNFLYMVYDAVQHKAYGYYYDTAGMHFYSFYDSDTTNNTGGCP